MAIAATIATAVISAAVTAYGQYEQAQFQSDVAKYQGKVARNQALAAKYAAEIAAENQAEEDRRTLAAQRARIGASGVLGDVGSPLLAQMEAAETTALNQARIRWGGETEARGHLAQEILSRYEAKQVRRLGYVQAGSTLLQGAVKAYGAYSAGGQPTTAGTGSPGYRARGAG